MFRSILLLVLLMPVLCFAEQRTQTVRGRVVDNESKAPLTGVIVAITDMPTRIGSATDKFGEFVLDEVTLGKHTVTITYMGFKSITLNDVLVTAGKETVLDIEMEESVTTMHEVTVSQKRDHINDMAIVSTRTFDVQETERYAGSRSDPARMASNFAGTQGGDDSRNDIIVRGNSPQGVLWRMEGIDIPNPNHFSIPGTTGGPVSILNSHTLANSDFFMGAFPAEYGDAVAGAFDVRLRNGNNDKYEFTAQLGLLGTEVVAEGPIAQDIGSSFLIAYRYSTLQLFQGLNIKIGTTSVPNYQDLTFKLNLPVSPKSTVSIFGIGGLSNINLVVSDLSEATPQLYGESDRNQYFTSNTGVVGASFGHTINQDTYTKLTIAETGSDVYAHHDYVFRDSNNTVLYPLKPILGYDFRTTSTVAHWFLNKKLSSRQTIKFGIINNLYNLNFVDSSRQYPPTRESWQYRENYHGYTDLAQAYIQYKYRPTEAITLTAGVHAQYLTHNQAKSVEPRLGLKVALTDRDVVTLGYGLHSEMLPMYQYFAHDTANTSAMPNYNVGFIRSHHMVLGYDRPLAEKLNLHLETYYQYLFDVPIETRIGSSYSALDQGTGYSRDFPGQLQNKGTGYNYGLELTLEKTFSHGYYVLLTGSVFDSKAKGNDGVYRNTDYNTHYSLNLLGGYEVKLGKYNTLITGIKVTMIGGRLYSPVDTAASNAYGDAVVIDSQRNTLHFNPYFRTDVKLGLRINGKRLTHEIGLDLVNVFNTKNTLDVTYSYGLNQQTAGKDPFYYTYQLGFLPIFYYKLDFGFK